MLKGIAPQMKAIGIYLQGQAVSEPSWQGYLLTVQNNTLQLLKLINIVFTQLQAHLPRQLPPAFDRAVSALKVYLSNRPHGQPEEQHGSGGGVWQQDEVARFLENKPQIDTKDEQRGELFKFLAMNEQKERNTQMMLEFVPRYSANHGLPHLPSLQRSSLFKNERVQRPSEGQSGQARESMFGKAVTHMSSSREAVREKERGTEAQAQTELTLLKCTYTITYQGQSTLCKESHDIGTEMSDFTPKRQQEQSKRQGMQKEEQAVISNQPNGKHETGQKQKNPQETNIQAERKGKNSEGKGERNSLASSNKLITKQQEKYKPKSKKHEEKRDSNLLSSSKKDVLKGVGKKQARKSKEIKENKAVKENKEEKEFKDVKDSMEVNELTDTYGRITNSSIFGKENKPFPTVNPFEAIKQTPQDFVASAEYCPTPQNGEPVVIQNARQEQTEQPEGTIESAIKEHQGHFDSLQKGDSLQETLQRDKSSSDKHHLTHFSAVTDQSSFSSTAAMPFYRKSSKPHQNNSSLPKIQERSRPKNDRTDSLKRRIYDSSPYLTTSLHYGAKQQKIINNKGMAVSNISCNQHAHHSLHMNPSDQSEREELLREEEAKMVREIQALGVRPAQKQWSRILRGIRHYQLMHATLCGQHCVHLSKFYQFLRRRNLASCLNRRLLLPHKKNIEITPTI